MATTSPPFLVWYDDSPRISTVRKIEDAIAAYSDRFGGIEPTLVLVNDQDVTSLEGVEVRTATNVRRNTFWVGREDGLAPERPITSLGRVQKRGNRK
ncbi:hypothetical protein [Candidatus Viridilinea mediisalina]|uniref:Uncharacterized protein n=1 Tax=Candidatus Viridilinea mediisalina TaxID=2024553 RepID=A0A2A6RP97_9CHLR|nr:hypothetical protein [Candidatus Viridilinea mediisalina]PDW04877.1 hypothetical protein CJ255_01340 [Candidatus Viridilinea mediisalina]